MFTVPRREHLYCESEINLHNNYQFHSIGDKNSDEMPKQGDCGFACPTPIQIDDALEKASEFNFFISGV